MRIRFVSFVLVILAACFVFCAPPCNAQSTDADVGGQITDEQGRVVPGVAVVLTNLNTGITYQAKTNGDGFYNAPNLPPGIYRANVTKDGFMSIVKGDIELHVQDVASINFQLQIGSVSETLTVEAGGLVINTTDGSVGTVVDRKFVDSIPLNGRSLQPFLTLTPGVVLTPATRDEQGQFSVNGQRSDANYFTVDGVSANFGSVAAGVPVGSAFGGAVPALNAGGGTNSLVSIDAVQELRVETSSYAPEFGRSPGGQVSIATRSGTNEFHGDVFDYFRNTVLDANDWFTNSMGEPRAPEHQNDFGGVLGGPIVKDRTFFFVSYEGLRLLQPATGQETVPDVAFRQSAPAAIQPLLNAQPIPNRKDFGNGKAIFAASYSNPTTLDAGSVRIDHKLTSKITIFGRYNYAASESSPRNSQVPNNIFENDFPIQTTTFGSTQIITSSATNDFRFNYSRSDASGRTVLDGLGGAVPVSDSLIFPSSFSSKNGFYDFVISGAGVFAVGNRGFSSQRQLNFVDTVSLSRGAHQLKFGADYRRLSPSANANSYFQEDFFRGLTGNGSIQSGQIAVMVIAANDQSNLRYHNVSLYAQDTWKAAPRLTLTYGLRWEINTPPQSTSGTPIYTVENLSDPANLALAPAGTPLYDTTYHNFAPRIGIAAEVSKRPGFQGVVRGGFGMFYDLGLGALANGNAYFPYSRLKVTPSVPFPVPSNLAAPPPFSTTIPASGISQIVAAVPDLQLPRTYQWNVAFEQGLGVNQTVSIGYVGALGQDLLRQNLVSSPSAGFFNVYVATNASSSNYNALQLQYQRRLSHGIQALAFYSFSHCIDDASNASSPFSADPRSDRGSCDFDIRHSFHGVITYDIPAPVIGGFGKAVLRGWAIDTIASVQSAPPIDLNTGLQFTTTNASITTRPDLVPRIPLYLYGQMYPGGKAINSTPGATTCPDGTPSVGPFCNPPTDSSGNPTRQGTLGRNALRGFGVTQIDFALRRQFNFSERWNLQFSAEAFNLFNHANFGNVDACTCDAPGPFGQATQMLNNALSAGGGQGGFNPLYQIGGPRSLQLALKLRF